MFIPATHKELDALGWEQLDIILITGDAYIDTSFCGVSIIGQYLIHNGYKVGIIPQPTLNTDADILKFGEPRLFWGVTAGAMDSMVSNYTALNKKRKKDDLTPNGTNNKRPDRATIKYVNLIKQYGQKNIPIIIGGIEANLRRLAHFDYWDNKIRRSILLDSKADFLVYGEGERTILEIANCLNAGEYDSIKSIRGLCYITNNLLTMEMRNVSEGYSYLSLPSYEQVVESKQNFEAMFNLFYQNNDPKNANGLIQAFGKRYIIQNPPNNYLIGKELDAVYELDYENAVHPIHQKDGEIRGLETTMFSVTTHRGCFGECNFCAITGHQGRTIRSRSKESILREVRKLTKDKRFKGNINDLGGATANMYMMDCAKQMSNGSCKHKRCLYPKLCKLRNISHSLHLNLIRDVLQIPKVKRVFINSGLRYDLIQFDIQYGSDYLKFLVANCVSGQMKIAPEHTEDAVLEQMGKPASNLAQFCKDFYAISKKQAKKQFLTYYLIAGHPGCSEREMLDMSRYFIKELKVLPEQIQIFTPTPSTYSTLMYYTEKCWNSDKSLFVEKSLSKLQSQKSLFTGN